MNFNEININELDLQNVGSWPFVARIVAVAIVFVAVLAGGFIFMVQPQLDALEEAEGQQTKHQKKLERVQRQQVDLDAFRDYLKDMETSFGAMLRQLPPAAEVENLVEDITQTGLANQLIFDKFIPGTAQRRAFYAQLPINIEVSGSYHQLGHFVNGVASLPRMVTLHNIRVSDAAKGSNLLSMKAEARIYWYTTRGGRG
ncbi:MAG: type 4a pilus biogenesis protein PilO [Gammaproteobacteria bacterium]